MAAAYACVARDGMTRVSSGFRPAAWLDPHDPASIRRFVRTYLLPALGPPTDPPIQENR